MTRVLLTHRYSMAVVRDLCTAGEMPAQHLWGAPALERAGFEVQLGLFGRDRLALKRLSWRLGNRLGDIEQQAALARRAGRDSVIYSGEASVLRGLVQLRRAGWRVPLVGVVHEPAAWMAGLDVAVCLSSRTRAQLIERHGRDPERTPVAPWGPDLQFPGYTPDGEELVVSTGKTERDVDTLRNALAELGLPARVYGERQALLPFTDVLADLRRASVVAIPLGRTDRVLALSEINDALALAKPIVMTRIDAIDFDPVQIGCGLTVAPHDVAGWREALSQLAHDPVRRRELGERGRRFAERGYNAEAFGAVIVDAVQTAAGRPSVRGPSRASHRTSGTLP